ncbi:Ger(x)C family spore germination protein [Paenibacillus sp. CF384]|uniref:Ger(x)C family spore germination protein n=1 Tax=Paenibacillus sp. CF384 TaxID=1884382 RepID=UPI000898B54A|nr:Ger(x)C family spore germination protein [Paenibacillus sp. CF384]SDW02815.1 germination protein, Ger(x)C family [Paenibacillus sp. CF384]
MRKYVLPLVLCFALNGCAKAQIIDRIKLIESIGYDSQGEAYKISGTYCAYDKKVKLFLLEGQVHSFNEVLTSFTSQSDHPIAIGQLRTIVISEQIARRGVTEIANTLVRDPHISNRATLVITTNQASEILDETLRFPPVYLSNLLKQNMDTGSLPFTNGHIFLDQYFGEGQDVFLPIVAIGPRGILQLNGVGVFKGDQLKLTLPNKAGLFIKLLIDDDVGLQSSTYDFKNDQDKQITFKIIRSKHNIIVTNEKVVISLKLDLDLGDYPVSLNVFENTHDRNALTQQIEHHLSVEIKALLEQFQKNLVDPIGIGNLLRSRERNWNEPAFAARVYPNLKFDVQTEVKILSLGVGH